MERLISICEYAVVKVLDTVSARASGQVSFIVRRKCVPDIKLNGTTPEVVTRFKNTSASDDDI